MTDVFGAVLFFAGVAFIVSSKSIAKWTSSIYARDAKSYSIKAIRDAKWNSPYAIMIFRIGMIIWGIVLILAAYTTIFGAINLT
jgi:hypothetical protein